MLIYKITNRINGKCYIGQTIGSIESRWKVHCQIRRKRSCPLLISAITLYGKENFIITEIERCKSKQHMNEREKYWIKFHGSFGAGYNLTSGGDRVELAEESRLKISKTLTGKPSSNKGRKSKFPAWNKGIPWSNEIRKKLSESHIGLKYPPRNPISEETRIKMSVNRIGKSATWNNKKVKCVNNGVIYNSCKDASESLGAPRSKICSVLKGDRKHTCGFVFEYVK